MFLGDRPLCRAPFQGCTFVWGSQVLRWLQDMASLLMDRAVYSTCERNLNLAAVAVDFMTRVVAIKSDRNRSFKRSAMQSYSISARKNDASLAVLLLLFFTGLRCRIWVLTPFFLLRVGFEAWALGLDCTWCRIQIRDPWLGLCSFGHWLLVTAKFSRSKGVTELIQIGL